ncbi:hypothetical protein VNO80_01313 [Phaseolus coccineus]|uniref:Uncharacterized protein n=1 Tax=Phaseolus coccineus TaxID=3886 RepID=A0AAN9RSN8_PHACN
MVATIGDNVRGKLEEGKEKEQFVPTTVINSGGGKEFWAIGLTKHQAQTQIVNPSQDNLLQSNTVGTDNTMDSNRDLSTPSTSVQLVDEALRREERMKLIKVKDMNPKEFAKKRNFDNGRKGRSQSLQINGYTATNAQARWS